MKRITKYSKRIKTTYMKTVAAISLVSFFLLPCFTKVEPTGDNAFALTLNDTYVGLVPDETIGEELMWKARGELASATQGFFFVETELKKEGKEVYFAQFDSEKEILSNMKNVLLRDATSAGSPAFTIKVDQTMVSLGSIFEVQQVLQAALDQYQQGKQFAVELGPNAARELSVLTAWANQIAEKEDEQTFESEAGVSKTIEDVLNNVESSREKSFDDFEYGLHAMQFADKIEIVESYLPKDQIMDVETATKKLIEKQAKEEIYEVEAGDTLSEIALKANIPLDVIIDLNENLEDENSLIRIGDEIKITSPEPALSIDRQEEVYYEENYEAEIEYIYNDDWYTTEVVTRQQPSAGHRKVAAIKSYRNEEETATEILKEDITIAAVPKIVEKGTKIPPTYIKPISGGRLSSNFGRRKAPKKGASTYHKGIDWATPVGTAVMASSGGIVAKAGWGSGYGYVVYINHADGRQTRYGHLSKVLVKPGQQVSQGQKIALSGNTGRSTGPHVHFEILIGGSQVNPLNYLN